MHNNMSAAGFVEMSDLTSETQVILIFKIFLGSKCDSDLC